MHECSRQSMRRDTERASRKAIMNTRTIRAVDNAANKGALMFALLVITVTSVLFSGLSALYAEFTK